MRLAKVIAGVIALSLLCYGCLNTGSSGKPWERHEGVGEEKPVEVTIEPFVTKPEAPGKDKKAPPGTTYIEASDL